jgi:hypothetical protein
VVKNAPRLTGAASVTDRSAAEQRDESAPFKVEFLEAHLACVGEHGGAVGLDVLVEPSLAQDQKSSRTGCDARG